MAAWLNLALTCALATSSTIVTIGSGTQTSVAATTFSIELIDGVDVGTIFDSSDDGRYLLIASAGFERLDTATGARVPVANAETWLDDVSDVVRTVTGPTSYERFTRSTGQRTRFEVPLHDVDNRLELSSIAASAHGRTVLTTSLGGFHPVVFVFDEASETLTEADQNGLAITEPRSEFVAIADDGTTVTIREWCCTGANDARWVRRHMTSGAVTTVEQPPEHDPFLGPWFASPNLRWVWFQSADGGIVPGVGAGPHRLYRRDVRSGATEAFPIPAGDVVVVRQRDDGSLISLAPGISGLSTDQTQLHLWTGGPTTIRLTDGIGGAEPDGEVLGNFWLSGDQTVVSFVSFASNLVPETAGRGRNRYLFQARLPSPGGPPPLGALGPNGSICVPAAGATTGDFVGVNITPVNGTTNGFGVLHSSDDAAPGTANVNFTAGSTDPNVAFAQVGADGGVCFTNSRHGSIDVVLDVLVVVDGTAFRLPSSDGAVRLADTRNGDGGSTLRADERRCVTATGAAPGEFVGVNITPVNAAERGNGSLHSSDDPAPATANVNFSVGSIDPNIAFAEVGADGRICFTNSRHGPVDLVLDALLVGEAGVFRSPTVDGAVRIADSRQAVGATRLAARATRCMAAGGAAAGEWVGVNITPVDAVTSGFGLMHSSDDPPGATANANFRPGSVDPNVAVVEVGTDGEVCFTNSRHGPVDVVIDLFLVGDPDVFRAPTTDGAARLVDTRD